MIDARTYATCLRDVERETLANPMAFMDVANQLGAAVGEPPLRPLPIIKAKVTRGYRPGVFPSCVICKRRPYDCECDPDAAQQALLKKLLGDRK